MLRSATNLNGVEFFGWPYKFIRERVCKNILFNSINKPKITTPRKREVVKVVKNALITIT